ncbi:MAG: hypothetical protein K2W96_20235 [Gemmataceae bacterium]|nr:hypothetical protein [Gemmataceae bacterium]
MDAQNKPSPENDAWLGVGAVAAVLALVFWASSKPSPPASRPVPRYAASRAAPVAAPWPQAPSHRSIPYLGDPVGIASAKISIEKAQQRMEDFDRHKRRMEDERVRQAKADADAALQRARQREAEAEAARRRAARR